MSTHGIAAAWRSEADLFGWVHRPENGIGLVRILEHLNQERPVA